MRPWEIEVSLTDGETELRTRVFFYVQPAEPNVGIMDDYPEVIGVFAKLPIGDICFNPTLHYWDEIHHCCYAVM